MKLCSSKIITALIAAASLCLPSYAEQAEQADKVRTKPPKGSPEYYEYRMERYNQFWRSLIPNQARVQYAGSVGAANIGLGWHYGGRDKRLWETDFMFGFVPKSSAPEASPSAFA